ncbi:Sugar (pentulose or hexulose) kinase [Nakamurella panacisegetis]|uniref:Sugar (Pentulose or hexulose) kinase n=1 Tax=Nakamurella panacisegetis TaxID=1090615 RepID=A0A1H0K820_9ACTN|nr:FGGY family carbohydrate kinase [Nakamurella panacisegetis]SDO52037.1 Sugar (pentulose or hexulose) kinase [Nakamurella panacisegetis]
MTTSILLGVDVGTSDSKVLATTTTGEEITSVSSATQWRNHGGQFTDTDPEKLASGVLALLDRAVAASRDLVGPVSVSAIAITGMAEAGVLLDESGVAVHPIMAWFDPRGGDEIQALPVPLLREFCGRTGLPANALATIAKLAWMRGQGTVLRGKQWLNVPEFLVHRLGGVRASEMSLAARTGLMDQDTGELWPEALAAIEADGSLIPPRVVAGTPLGRAGGPEVPVGIHGAVLTIAGHDHPVAAVGCGATGADEIFDSFGTAEALVRSVDGNLDAAARDRLASAGVNSVHHVLAGRRLLLGGTKAGLLLRRTLDMLGAGASERRAELDRSACELSDTAGEAATEGIRIWGAANNDGTLRINVTTDAVSPAAIWLATLDHAVDEAARCLDLMAAEIGPASAVVVAGGWTRMQSVRQSKESSLPNVRFSDRSQAGAFGATMFAAHAALVAERLTTTGDSSGNSLALPDGPSEAFAARYTHRTQTLEEITT